MWQLSPTVFVSWALALGCAPSRAASGTLENPGHSTAASVTRPAPPSVPAPAASSTAKETKHRFTPGPVVPPEHLPEFDPALVRSLGTEGVRKLEVAASMCPAAVVHDAGKLRVGCRTCPPFDASTGPDGKVVVDPPQDDEFYELEALFDGSFTAPAKSQTAAVFRGCESHAENFGGTLLAERSGAVWVQKSYRSGFHPASCRTFSKGDAQDMLVCLWETDHQSSVHWLLDTYDFNAGDDEHPENGWNNLLTVDDDSIPGCWNRRSSKSRVTADKITNYVVQPGTAQSPPRVVVRVRFARGPASATYRAQCARLDKSKEVIDLGATLKSETRDLVLVWDGKGFIADAHTKATMKQFGLEMEEPAPAP
jgi:hypothetical protein